MKKATDLKKEKLDEKISNNHEGKNIERALRKLLQDQNKLNELTMTKEYNELINRFALALEK